MNANPTPESISSGLGILALEDFIECGGDGSIHRFSEGPANAGEHSGASTFCILTQLDFLDALVALGFLRRANGEYSNTPETDMFLDKQKPSYVSSIWKWRTPVVRFLESSNRSARSGTAAERDAQRRRAVV